MLEENNFPDQNTHSMVTQNFRTENCKLEHEREYKAPRLV